MAAREHGSSQQRFPSPAPNPPPLRIARAALLAISLALALVAGMTTHELTTGIAPRAASEGPVEPSLELVRGFYALVNDAIVSGDLAGVTSLFAPAPGEAPGAGATDIDDLLARIAGIHATDPAAQLTVADVRAYGGAVLGRAELHLSRTATFLGLPLSSAGIDWGDAELFRVARGRIVEYWSAPTSQSEFTPYAAGQLFSAPFDSVVPLIEEATYEPGAIAARAVAPGPFALFLRAGTLSIDVDNLSTGPARLAGPGGATQASGPGISRSPFTAQLETGELLLLAPMTAFTITNPATERADALVMTVAMTRMTSMVPTTAMPDIGIDARTRCWGGAATLPSGATLAVGGATLAPGAAIPLHEVAGSEFVLVERGALEVIADGEPASVKLNREEPAVAARVATLQAGACAMVTSGSLAEYRNATAEPVGLLLITVQPPADPAR